MASLEILTGRDYLSYSSLTSWLDCGERFRLERVLNAPQSEAWWFIAGDAIHKASEDADIDGATDPAAGHDYFFSNWNNSIKRLRDEGVDFDSIKAGGRKTNAYPGKENHLFWETEGPAMVANWIRWRTNAINSGWHFFELPDGSPAIEVPVQVEFDDVLVKGYIDRVLVNPNGELVVVDLKSGSRTPDSSLQLGVYAHGMTRNFGVTPTIGAYYMTRKGDLAETRSLSHYTHEALGDWFSAAKRGIEAEVFIPHVGPFCGTCSVAQFCKAQGGDPAPLVKGLVS